MVFYISQKVASVKNASKTGTILELGDDNPQGIQWVKVRFKGGKGRWTLSDALRPYQASKSIPVPDGVIVLIRPGHSPELFQQLGSEATDEDCYKFLTAIQAMFLSRGRNS